MRSPICAETEIHYNIAISFDLHFTLKKLNQSKIENLATLAIIDASTKVGGTYSRVGG
jgi:hypothetical protein